MDPSFQLLLIEAVVLQLKVLPRSEKSLDKTLISSFQVNWAELKEQVKSEI